MTIEELAKDFKSYVNELQMPRDDYKGIMEYIDDALSLLKEQERLIEEAEERGFERGQKNMLEAEAEASWGRR